MYHVSAQSVDERMITVTLTLLLLLRETHRNDVTSQNDAMFEI